MSKDGPGSWPSYRGTVYRTTGPPYGGSWDGSRVRSVAVGTASIGFSDYNNATFMWSIDGASGQKALTRTKFGTLASQCHGEG